MFDVSRHRLIAILRGVKPDEVVAIGQALYTAGMRAVEVPLNSPEPLQSVARLRATLPADCLVGVGTVLDVAQVEAAHAAGAQLVVSPDTNVEVIRRSKALGMVSLPGCATPTEAFAALRAGADGLKMFPFEMVAVAGVKAMRAVLPRTTPLLVVGGVTPAIVREHVRDASSIGIDGWGLGSALYKPGEAASVVAERATAFVAALTDTD